MDDHNCDLDPRISIELESLNSATDNINKLENELEVANSTFNLLLNESTRRLKLSSKKLGRWIEKVRPYYDALEKARVAQIECQKAAVKFQRANENHTVARETLTLAEQKFISNLREWQYDNAWQEMLNHATQKVNEAEKQKAECHAEHQTSTKIFNSAEKKVHQLEKRLHRSIEKSRPHFEGKEICQDQLQTQKNYIEQLQMQLKSAKSAYSTAMRNLEQISDEIHRQRGDHPLASAPPTDLREPGVGAELSSLTTTAVPRTTDCQLELGECDYFSTLDEDILPGNSSHLSTDLTSMANASTQCASHVIDNSETEELKPDQENCDELLGVVDESDLEELRQKVKILAVRPIECADGEQQCKDAWEHELAATVNKLDHLMLLSEYALKQQKQQPSQLQNVGADLLPTETPPQLHEDVPEETTHTADNKENAVIVTDEEVPLLQSSELKEPMSTVNIPMTQEPTAFRWKNLKKIVPMSTANVAMRELPLLARLYNKVSDRSSDKKKHQRRSSN